MTGIWTPSADGLTVGEVSNTLADHLERLVAVQAEARGDVLPHAGQGSAAARHLAAEPSLRTDVDVAPVRDALGTIERITFAAEDELVGLARVLRGEQPLWFAHIPLIRGAVELLCRSWWLSDPGVDGAEMIRRHWNERLYEASFVVWQAKAASAMPAEAVADAERVVAELCQSASGWGAAHGYVMSGKYLGDVRPSPPELLVQLYEANDQGVVGMDAVARDQYSKLSAVSHGLPQALTQYMVDPDDSDHGHMRLDSAKLLAPFAVLVTAHEAAVRRLFSFFGWTVTTELEGELFAIRLWWNRASGLVEGD